MIVISTILILIVALALGMPIPFSFGAAVFYIAVAGDYQFATLLPGGFSKLNTIVILAIPLFIYAGAVIQRGKVADPLVDLAEILFKRLHGGLSVALVLASGLFGSISGSAAATLSCIGSILLPKMHKQNYPSGITCALIANAAPLGLLIPPSSIQILYAWVGQVSVLACFLATVIPGIILMTLLSIVSLFLLRKSDIKLSEEMAKPLTMDVLLKRTKLALPACTMPALILGGIYGGIMTPTEAAGVSVLLAMTLGFLVYKGLTWKNFIEATFESGTTTGVVMVMLFVVMILSRLFVFEDFSNVILTALRSISSDPMVIMLMLNLFMVIIGMLMDDTSGVLICTPILLPIARELGVSPIQFAAILGVNLGMGNITPPTAPLLYLAARVGNTPVTAIMRPTIYYIIFAWLPTLFITIFIPEVSLYLPNLLLGQ